MLGDVGLGLEIELNQAIHCNGDCDRFNNEDLSRIAVRGSALLTSLKFQPAYPNVSKCYVIRVFTIQILRFSRNGDNGQNQS